MDRDRDEPQRSLGRGRGPDRNDDRPLPRPADRFDPAEWDKPVDPPPDPSPAARARNTADFAQFFSLISALETGIQRLLVNFGLIRDVVADTRASLAEEAARAAQRAEAEEARDKLIAARLVDPETLAHHAEAGARQGAREALDSTVREWRRQLAADADARELISKQMAADQANRRDDEMRRRRRDGWRNGGFMACALLIPITSGFTYYAGRGDGKADGYSQSRDEKAAESWANTPNGKLARQIDTASQQTIPDIAACPKSNGWKREKRDGVYWCFGANPDHKSYNGWLLP